MELKDFIKETVGAIIQASQEIANEHREAGVEVSPPVTGTERDVFDPTSDLKPFRRVISVKFDVAVTASSETGGGGKAGLKILSVEAGVDGKHTSRNEAVSRVQFSVPFALGPEDAEHENRRRSSHRAAESSLTTDWDPLES